MAIVFSLLNVGGGIGVGVRGGVDGGVGTLFGSSRRCAVLVFNDVVLLFVVIVGLLLSFALFVLAGGSVIRPPPPPLRLGLPHIRSRCFFLLFRGYLVVHGRLGNFPCLRRRGCCCCCSWRLG